MNEPASPPVASKTSARLAAGLLALGLVQITASGVERLGVALGGTTLERAGAAGRAIAAATGASPHPKVFTAVDGLETWTTRFFFEWDEPGSPRRSVELTAELYAQLRGPYLRRNTYGAALAYGPVLQADERTRPLFASVARFALAGDAPLLRELGLPADHRTGPVTLRYEYATPNRFADRIEIAGR